MKQKYIFTTLFVNIMGGVLSFVILMFALTAGLVLSKGGTDYLPLVLIGIAVFLVLTVISYFVNKVLFFMFNPDGSMPLRYIALGILLHWIVPVVIYVVLSLL